MNFENQGIGIFKIYKDKDDKKGKTVYISPDGDNLAHSFDEIKRKGNEIYRLIPAIGRERSILYVTGASGSGKSYFTNSYVKEYKKMYPKRPVYLFSSLTEDKTLDSNKSIKRIKLNDTFINTAFSTLCIFDDCDCIVNKTLKKKVFTILDVLLQTGRHSSTDIVFTSHLCCDKNNTKVILAEATSITAFPRTLGTRSLKYLTESYFGMTKEDIQKIKRLKTRPVTIIRSYPPLVLYDSGAYLFNHECVD